ncbi:MAG TPA: DUF1415 domain-containing protein [Paucimonas sp.]|nr:DUF1415 domain-containing protein [Paucimonas sp.]
MAAIEATRIWVDKAVIGLNLCPFAKAVQVKRQIRYAVSGAHHAEELLDDLAIELRHLEDAEPALLDTTILIHPYVLTDFLDYNDFLEIADDLVTELGLAGELQIASFHPDYQFADAAVNDIANFTNRSPYPVLHLLRETSVERAVTSYPDTEDIYRKNIETMRRLGHAGWHRLGLTPQKK